MRRLVFSLMVIAAVSSTGAAAQLPETATDRLVRRSAFNVAAQAGVAVPSGGLRDIASTGLHVGGSLNIRLGESGFALRFSAFQDQFEDETLATGERYEPTLTGYGTGLLYSPRGLDDWWFQPYFVVTAGQTRVEVSAECDPAECSVGLPTFTDDEGAYVSGTFGLQRTLNLPAALSATLFGETTAKYTWSALTAGTTTEGFASFVPFAGGLALSFSF